MHSKSAATYEVWTVHKRWRQIVIKVKIETDFRCLWKWVLAKTQEKNITLKLNHWHFCSTVLKLVRFVLTLTWSYVKIRYFLVSKYFCSHCSNSLWCWTDPIFRSSKCKRVVTAYEVSDFLMQSWLFIQVHFIIQFITAPNKFLHERILQNISLRDMWFIDVSTCALQKLKFKIVQHFLLKLFYAYIQKGCWNFTREPLQGYFPLTFTQHAIYINFVSNWISKFSQAT